MARREQDREDILREATALVERAELECRGFEEPVVVGFRRNGAASCFFGADFVVQFNVAGQLRRAFRQGQLIKAERGRLVSMTRDRREGQVVLQPHELDGCETDEFLAEATQLLSRLAAQLDANALRVAGKVPEDKDVAGRVRAWLNRLLSAELTIASRPHAGNLARR